MRHCPYEALKGKPKEQKKNDRRKTKMSLEQDSESERLGALSFPDIPPVVRPIHNLFLPLNSKKKNSPNDAVIQFMHLELEKPRKKITIFFETFHV